MTGVRRRVVVDLVVAVILAMSPLGRLSLREKGVLSRSESRRCFPQPGHDFPAWHGSCSVGKRSLAQRSGERNGSSQMDDPERERRILEVVKHLGIAVRSLLAACERLWSGQRPEEPSESPPPAPPEGDDSATP
jgi:hypothetical protein